jgi:hypothetical protein
MNETGRPPERPATYNLSAPSIPKRPERVTHGERAWLRSLDDAELGRLVCGLHAVDRAADAGRRAREAA